MRVKKPKLTESEKIIAHALRTEYRYRSDAILFQVPFVSAGSDGKNHLRKIDALAISCWSSRKNEIHGFEMKGSRQTWLFEIENPQKAHDVASYCDLWSIISIPNVVRLEELPNGWGFAEVVDGKLSWKRHPEERKKPLELSRDILFSVISAMMQQYRKSAPEDDLEHRYRDGFSEGRKEAQTLFMETISRMKNTGPDPLEEIRRVIGRLEPEKIEVCAEILSYVVKGYHRNASLTALRLLKFLRSQPCIEALNSLCDAEDRLKSLLAPISKLKRFLDEKKYPEFEVHEPLDIPPAPGCDSIPMIKKPEQLL